jgi:Ser/Thr protein kinase RdoA (MazF antagonist)
MSSSYLTAVLKRFRIVARQAGGPVESRSGAGVLPVATADGRDAFVKLTPVTQGPAALAAARRELRFYRSLAPTVPVMTPTLLDSADTDDGGVALLLEAAGEPVDAGSWTPRMWAALGRGLAALHEMPAPADVAWAAPDDVGRTLADPDLATVEAFWRPGLPRLTDVLAQRGALDRAMRALPPVFVHGDCHPANIAYAAGAPVFLDWQASGVGRATADLAFPSVRVTPAGVSVPPAMLDAYLEHRNCDRPALRRALLAEELAVLIFQWPYFAAYNSAAGIDRIRRRARDLAERWFAGGG